MQKFPIILVTYNPQFRTLAVVESLIHISFVQDIFIIDNTEKDNEVITQLVRKEKITLIRNGRNRGIAYAQNIGLELAIHKGYSWALMLDQDTIINDKLLDKYDRYIVFNNCDKVGIICTDYVDVGTGKSKFENQEIKAIQETISSGSLLNLSIFEKIGYMKEEYFIDQVDNEYCYRLNKNSYKIVLLPGADMEHKLGNIEMKTIFGKTFCLYNQSPIRTYYRTRNMIYMMKEYPDKQLRRGKLKAMINHFIIILFEKESLKKCKMMVKGIIDGNIFYPFS